MAARKAVEQELTREMIMDVARELFRKKGYSQVSMRQLAQALGYSHGALYYHFKNKAELFYTLVREDFALIDQELASILTDPTLQNEEKLYQVLLGFIQFGIEHPSHYEIMFLIKDEELDYWMEEAPNDSYERFALAIKELSPQPVSIQQVWSLFLALHGFVVHYCGSGQTFKELESLAHAHVQFLLKSIIA